MPWEKQFDKKEALQKAMKAFWAGGYEATSLCDLLDAMGIQKGSFYATYSSKHELLIDCLELYVESQFSCVEGLLNNHSPKQALEDHFEGVCDQVSGSNQKAGCFLLNATLELASTDEKVRELSKRGVERQTAAYRKLIEAGQEAGEISKTLDPQSTAQALWSLAVGMQVLGRASMPKEAIESVCNEALRMINRT